MKKSLLAVAAIGAFASAAQAQSSVTVYGILDVGYIGSSTNNYFNDNSKTTSNQIGASAETSSRLGFKGTEDLGGGNSAFFTAEFQLYPTNATLSADQFGSATNTGLVNRQAFVGLAKKGLGNASVGGQYTPIHEAVGATDPGQTNNVVGSIIYPAKVNGADVNTGAYTIRGFNSLVVKSEKFAGFSAKAFYNLNDTTSTDNTTAQASYTSGGTLNQVAGWGLGADYTLQKLYVAAAVQQFKNTTTGGSVNLTANNNDNQFYGAATYDFGILKAYVNYINRKVTGTNANTASRTGQQIGLRSFITPTIEAWASAGNGRVSANANTTYTVTSTNPTVNFTAYQLGSNYWLSKRTNLYAIFGSNHTSSSSTTLSEGATQYAVGVRHTF
jgi:predicted porin